MLIIRLIWLACPYIQPVNRSILFYDIGACSGYDERLTRATNELVFVSQAPGTTPAMTCVRNDNNPSLCSDSCPQSVKVKVQLVINKMTLSLVDTFFVPFFRIERNPCFVKMVNFITIYVCDLLAMT